MYEYDDLSPVSSSHEVIHALNGLNYYQNDGLTRAYREYKERLENRQLEQRFAFAVALKEFRSSSAFRKGDKRVSSKAEARLRAEWACSSNESYVRVFVSALVDCNVVLTPDYRAQLQHGCELALKDQLRSAYGFLRFDKWTHLLFGDHDLAREIYRLVDDHCPTGVLKINQLFEWATREMETRRMERMPKPTYNQTNIIHNGNPNISQTGNILVLTSGELDNLASELASLRSTLQSRFTAQTDTIDLLQQAETASKNKDGHQVQSVLQSISKSGWSAIRSVAPQITSQVILTFLKNHGLA